MFPTTFWVISPSGFNQKLELPMAACLWTDWDEMCNINRRPSMDASYQVLVHLANRFQGRTFLEICQPETRIDYGGFVFKGLEQINNIYRGASIDNSYQVLVHLAVSE